MPSIVLPLAAVGTPTSRAVEACGRNEAPTTASCAARNDQARDAPSPKWRRSYAAARRATLLTPDLEIGARSRSVRCVAKAVTARANLLTLIVQIGSQALDRC